MIPRSLIRKQHREIDLQRPMVDGQLRYQSLCHCGRKAVIGSRAQTQSDQKTHRRNLLNGVR